MSGPSSDQDPAFVRAAFASIARRYVLTNHVLSLGFDLWWRRRVARAVARHEPERVIDVATGSGDLAASVRRSSPGARVVGVDFCAPMLAEARKRGLADLLVADGLALPFPDATFDALTIGYGLRNMEDRDAGLREFARVLRPGGVLAVLDFSLPPSPLLRGPYRFYLHRVLPVLAGWLTGNREAYAYLGESIEGFPSGPDMVARIEDAGFEAVEWRPQLGGISSLYLARREAEGYRRPADGVTRRNEGD